MRGLVQCAWLSLFLVCSIATLVAAEDKEDFQGEFEMTSIDFTVNDESGNPISDAAVRCYAMRCVDESAHYGWPTAIVGEMTTAQSDSNGAVTVAYPEWWRRDAGTPFRTRLISVVVKHPKYILSAVHFDLADQPVLTLKKGLKVETLPVDASGEPIKRARPMISGRAAPHEWIERDGRLLTECAGPGNVEMMLFGLDNEDRCLFSEATPLIFEEGEDVDLGSIELSPGFQIQGEISENVPRPVHGGHVVGVFQPLLPLEGWQTLTWDDSVPIEEDGTFEFESVPRGGYAQLIAFCEGWVIENGELLKKGSFTVGHRIDMNEPVVKPLLPMVRMFSINVTAAYEDGKPAAEISIGVNPNQYYMEGGSTMLGRTRSDRGWLANELDGTTKPYWERQFSSSHYGKTDEQGKLRLRNVPEASLRRVSVSDTRYQNSQANTDDLKDQVEKAKEGNYEIDVHITVRP